MAETSVPNVQSEEETMAWHTGEPDDEDGSHPDWRVFKRLVEAEEDADEHGEAEDTEEF